MASASSELRIPDRGKRTDVLPSAVARKATAARIAQVPPRAVNLSIVTLSESYI